jgi:hypothetical protein
MLAFAGGRSANLRGRRALSLTQIHGYAVVPDKGRTGDWSVETLSYIYEIRPVDGPSIIEFHWHPVGRSLVSWPHLHLPAYTTPVNLSRAHVPMGHVTRQAVLRFAIDELGVEPLREDWRAVLDATERAYLADRTWG